MKLVLGSPFASEKTNEIAQQALNEKYGLDKFVLTIIKRSFPISAKIGVLAIVFAVVLGIPLGCLSALKREKWEDSVIRIISTLGIAEFLTYQD